MNSPQLKSIIYVNFAPYENAGKILDYLLENFNLVCMFSLSFYRMGKKQTSGKLFIYKNKKLIKTISMFQFSIKIPISLIFLLLPFRSFINFIQLIWYGFQLKKWYGEFDYYFTVNAFTAWIGNMLRSLRIVKRTIFWVWDYYPPYHANKIILIIRWLYWQFDKAGTQSDRLVFLSKRLLDLRKDINVLPKSADYPVVPIGTTPISKIVHKKNDKIILGFLGVLKKSQGIDILFDCADKLQKKFPTVSLEIIGAGPDIDYFKSRAKQTKMPVKFYGFVSTNKEIETIMNKWTIGTAPYVIEESNVSYYTDPSKIKSYFALGIPVILTKIYFSKEVEKHHAGIIISHNKSNDLVDGINKILKDYSFYQKNALTLATKYNYKKIYPAMFFFPDK